MHSPSFILLLPAALALHLSVLVQAQASYNPIEMLCAVNKIRAQHGLAALGPNPALETAAQRHSNYQARKRTMSHTGAGGSDPAQRIEKAGYNWMSVAENVAYGYSNQEQCLDEWMKSPGHRANILKSDVTHLGSAVGYTSDGVAYYTQDFGGDGRKHNYPGCPTGYGDNDGASYGDYGQSGSQDYGQIGNQDDVQLDVPDYSPSDNQDYSQSDNQDYSPSDNQGDVQLDVQSYSPSANQDFSPSDNQDFSQSDDQDYSPSANQDYSPSANQDFSPSDNQDYSPSDNQDFSQSDNQDYSPSDSQDYSPSDNQSYDDSSSPSADYSSPQSYGMPSGVDNDADSYAPSSDYGSPQGYGDYSPSPAPRGHAHGRSHSPSSGRAGYESPRGRSRSRHPGRRDRSCSEDNKSGHRSSHRPSRSNSAHLVRRAEGGVHGMSHWELDVAAGPVSLARRAPEYENDGVQGKSSWKGKLQ